MAGCVLCESESEGLGIKGCSACEQVFCSVHRKDHQCLPPDEMPDPNEDVSPAHHPAMPEEEERSEGQLVAGAILLAAGAVLSLSTTGAIVGAPLALLGFAVMFPQHRQIMIAISVFVFLLVFAFVGGLLGGL